MVVPGAKARGTLAHDRSRSARSCRPRRQRRRSGTHVVRLRLCVLPPCQALVSGAAYSNNAGGTGRSVREALIVAQCLIEQVLAAQLLERFLVFAPAVRDLACTGPDFDLTSQIF